MIKELQGLTFAYTQYEEASVAGEEEEGGQRRALRDGVLGPAADDARPDLREGEGDHP